MSDEAPTGVAGGPRTKPPFRADHIGSLLRRRQSSKRTL